MAKHKKLRVETSGARHYISVPADRAQSLHTYLRGNRVLSDPPQPACTGFDTIDLGKGVNVAGVQALLNAWS